MTQLFMLDKDEVSKVLYGFASAIQDPGTYGLDVHVEIAISNLKRILDDAEMMVSPERNEAWKTCISKNAICVAKAAS